MNKFSYLGFLGMIINVIAAIIIALNTPYTAWGFVLYLVGNVLWCLVSIKINEKSLFIQNIFFGIINCIAITRWFHHY